MTYKTTEVFFLLNLRKNKKGMTSIEIVIGMLIFIIVFSFLVDTVLIMWKFAVVAQTNTEVARITGLQGGARTSAPTGYPGGNNSYLTIHQLNSLVNDKMKSAGFKDNEWSMTIGSGGRIGANGVSSVEHDYKQTFSTKLNAKYRWSFMSNWLPLNLEQTLTSKRMTISEWKYNYSIWDGEN